MSGQGVSTLGTGILRTAKREIQGRILQSPLRSLVPKNEWTSHITSCIMSYDVTRYSV